ncbi:MAG: hypothetical protein HW383_614 [Candidatus Magasanikbacteria bacterium]|nr:hypothetical protein [Candidatus Magasanikbacteria bacterium]
MPLQQFVVPQFIDTEDKVIGPITVRQFIILLVTAFMEFILYKLLVFTYFLIFGILLLLIGGAIAFVRLNGQPFHFFLVNIAQYVKRSKMRTWQKDLSNATLREHIMKVELPPPPPPFIKAAPSKSRLQDLALVVNTGGVYKPEEE